MAKEGNFCHVFLNFRGEVRIDFIQPLYDTLKADGFQPFMDKADMGVGDELKSSIQEGIKNSMSAIVVFSKNYAFSTWCLNELILILERKRTSRYFIIPILYGVKSADVKHQVGSFGAALEKHKRRNVDNKQIKKWKAALEEAGDLIGLHFEETPGFIPKIVELFRKRFSVKFPEYTLPSAQTPILHGKTNNQHEPTEANNIMKPTIIEDAPSKVAKRVTPSTIQPKVYPLSGYGDKCPPDGEAKVVLYTSAYVCQTLHDCNEVKSILIDHQYEFEERDASKYPQFKDELKELVKGSSAVSYPWLFVMGKDIGGLKKVEELRDNGQLDAILNYYRQQQQGNMKLTPSPTDERKEKQEQQGNIKLPPLPTDEIKEKQEEEEEEEEKEQQDKEEKKKEEDKSHFSFTNKSHLGSNRVRRKVHNKSKAQRRARRFY